MLKALECKTKAAEQKIQSQEQTALDQDVFECTRLPAVITALIKAYLLADSHQFFPLLPVAKTVDIGFLATHQLQTDLHLVIGSHYSPIVRLFNINTDAWAKNLQGHTANVFTMIKNPRNSTIITGAEDGNVRIWDPYTSTCLHSFNDHDQTITGLALTSHNKLIAASTEGFLSIRNADSGNSLGYLPGFPLREGITSMTLLPSGHIAICSPIKTVDCMKIIDPENPDRSFYFGGWFQRIYEVTALDNGYIMSNSLNNGIRKIWDPKTGKLVKTLMEKADITLLNPDSIFETERDLSATTRPKPRIAATELACAFKRKVYVHVVDEPMLNAVSNLPLADIYKLKNLINELDQLVDDTPEQAKSLVLDGATKAELLRFPKKIQDKLIEYYHIDINKVAAATKTDRSGCAVQ